MPTILIKKSDTPSAVPTGSDLTNLAGGAEIAVNTADKRVFSMNSSSAIIELGTNPQSITVSSGSTLNGGVVINELGANADTRIEGDTDANLFFVDASTDRIGIGTSSPGAKVNLEAADGVSEVRLSRASTNIWGSIQQSSVSGALGLAFNANDGNAATPGFVWRTATDGSTFTEQMVLNTTGLGIGTSSPGYALDVRRGAGVDSYLLLAGNNGGTTSGLLLGQDSAGLSRIFQIGSNPISFWTDSAERMRLDASGNLLVNCTSGNGKLTVRGPGTTTGYSFEAANSGGATRFLVSDNGLIQFYKSDNAESARITSGGALLVGTTSASPGYGNTNTGVQISASGSNFSRADVDYVISANQNTADAGTYYLMIFRQNNVSVGTITSNTTTTTYGTSSDVRLKKNIVNAQDSGADVDALQVRSFDWKLDDTHVKYGFIAQELVTVAPEAVVRGDDGEEVEKTWNVDYSKLVPMLVKEIQSLRARVAALEAK